MDAGGPDKVLKLTNAQRRCPRCLPDLTRLGNRKIDDCIKKDSSSRIKRLRVNNAINLIPKEYQIIITAWPVFVQLFVVDIRRSTYKSDATRKSPPHVNPSSWAPEGVTQEHKCAVLQEAYSGWKQRHTHRQTLDEESNCKSVHQFVLFLLLSTNRSTPSYTLISRGNIIDHLISTQYSKLRTRFHLGRQDAKVSLG